MSFLRSVFISGFVACLIAAFAYAVVQLVRGMDPVLSWFGMALAAIGPLLFFSWVFVRKPARTEPHPVGYSIVCGLGLAITMAMSWRYGEAAGSIHVWAGLALVGWMTYLLWYSPFRQRNSRQLVVGARLPDFKLQDTDGKPVSFSGFTAQPHVLLFYRGNWCPFCTAQISELAQNYREIEAAGARVVLISPQPLNKQKAIASRFEIPMHFLRDPDNQAAKLLGIFDAWGTPMGMQVLGYDSDTVMPTVVITGADGRIIYSHQTSNYRIRPEPGEFLKVLAEYRS